MTDTDGLTNLLGAIVVLGVAKKLLDDDKPVRKKKKNDKVNQWF
jgi:hypothetical protein